MSQRLRIQLSFVVEFDEVPAMTADITDAFAGAVTGLYPTAMLDGKVARFTIIEAGGTVGITRLGLAKPRRAASGGKR